MEIILNKDVLLYLHKLGLTEEEILDAAVLPDTIEELPDGQKEFFKRFNEKVLKLTILVEEQRRILVQLAQWVEK